MDNLKLDDVIEGFRPSIKPKNQTSNSDENRCIVRATPADDWQNMSLDEKIANMSNKNMSNENVSNDSLEDDEFEI